MEPIGIIAGNRELPLMITQSARGQGIDKIAAVGFRGITSPKLPKMVDAMSWIGLGELGGLIRFFKANKVSRLVMVGQIPHRIVLRALKFDSEGWNFFKEVRENNAKTVLGALIEKLEKEGFQFLDSTQFLKERLTREGVLSGHAPNPQQMDDLKYGWKIARTLADLEAGQTVVVKQGILIALEGVEGTDRTILRGGKLGGRGTVVVKVARSNQDMRYDVPVIGLKTLNSLKKAKACVMGIEEGKTLILEGDEFFRRAKKLGITIVGLQDGKNKI